MHRVQRSRKASWDKILTAGIVLWLAGFTLTDKLIRHLPVPAALLPDITIVVTVVCTILFFALELGYFVKSFLHRRSVKKDEQEGQKTHVLLTILLNLLFAVICIFIVCMLNPARYRSEAVAILSNQLTGPRALDDLYYILYQMMSPVFSDAPEKFLFYGMQFYWMVWAALIWRRIGRILFKDWEEQEWFRWIAAGLFLLPVFSSSMDGLGFYTDLWRKDALLNVLFVPLYFLLLYELFLVVRKSNWHGAFICVLRLLIVTAAGFSCSRIVLLYLLLTLATGFICGSIMARRGSNG